MFHISTVHTCTEALHATYLNAVCPVADCREALRRSDVIHQEKCLGFMKNLSCDAVKPLKIIRNVIRDILHRDLTSFLNQKKVTNFTKRANFSEHHKFVLECSERHCAWIKRPRGRKCLSSNLIILVSRVYGDFAKAFFMRHNLDVFPGKSNDVNTAIVSTMRSSKSFFDITRIIIF